jgi:Glycosyltransferases, probably involved in cell wall biogenesis
LFSVIIPLYNKAAYVEKAIQSVLAQTYPGFELIVVNDGSSDNSLEVVRNCQLSIINYQLIDQPNQGVSIARNNGVKVAKYDYIAFLDADDWWEPAYLAEMKKLIEKFPEAGIYGCGYNKIKNGKIIWVNIGVEPGFERGLINYCRVYAKTMYMPLWTGATVIRKTVFESEGGFKPELKLGEDFDLWIRVAMKYPVAFLNKSLANYNQDVDLKHRAIGEKLYEPQEHMFFTDYGKLMENADFRYLYERLVVYGLLPYYLAEKNKKEVDLILSEIHWENHAFKYRLYYKILPKRFVQLWLEIMKLGSGLKKMLTT